MTERQLQGAQPRFFTFEMMLIIIAAVAGIGIIWLALSDANNIRAQIFAGITFTLSIVAFLRLVMDPDSVRARQSDAVLKIASKTLECSKDGLTQDAAQKICELLLPATAAIAVAITDKEHILGYAGYSVAENPQGAAIRTRATHQTIEDGEGRIMLTTEEIGLPNRHSRINAAIITPLYIGRNIEGTLKFYYRKPSQISQTQRSMAEGFAELISTQMAASALEEQTRLATSMELKALQAQINPHFLFNTINTIASLIRTDPAKARILLRDFAVFYRRTLEDSSDLIALEREIDQVQRYLSFETARFGEERLKLEVEVEPGVASMMVPSFLVQPLVENSVKHAMPSEGCLTIRVSARCEGDEVVIRVTDDGIGMSEETRNNIMHPSSAQGLGIAVKNVRDRMRSYFGSDARMEVESNLGEGTTVSFRLNRRMANEYLMAGNTLPPAV